jgi:TolB-like protein/DNA-binding winged helix-turn-helix (wHTH) protein
MDRLVTVPIRVGEWRVDPVLGQLSKGQEIVKMEARAMRLLLHLAYRTGEVVSIDELLNEVWAGVVVTPDSVYQAIASLRRLFGDDPKQPRYIATVQRMGYRMVADVTPCADMPVPPGEPLLHVATMPSTAAVADLSEPNSNRQRWTVAIGVACLIFVILGAVYWVHNRPPSAVRASIAVLPFLDLTTQEMNEEFFADGMTEELIGDLSKVPAFQVPSRTASFNYKGKQLPVADIARQLGVTFVLDGSVRKSGNTYRVSVRLTQADTGYVVWSESYDRPLGDLVQVQQDVAAETTKAVRASIGASARESAPAPLARLRKRGHLDYRSAPSVMAIRRPSSGRTMPKLDKCSPCALVRLEASTRSVHECLSRAHL